MRENGEQFTHNQIPKCLEWWHNSLPQVAVSGHEVMGIEGMNCCLNAGRQC